jgi:hypothetical protein
MKNADGDEDGAAIDRKEEEDRQAETTMRHSA